MERKNVKYNPTRQMLNTTLQDKVPCSEIGKITKKADIKEYIQKQKWKWAGHNYKENERQQMDQAVHRMAAQRREEIQGTTKQKVAG